MLTRILQSFSAPTRTPLPEPDANLALGALLVRVAKSDDRYQVEEIQRIDRLLGRLQGLNPVEAAQTRATCEKLENQAPDTEKFAALIRESVGFEQRFATLIAMWQVALADGVEKPQELAVLNGVRQALGLSEQDNDLAHARAISE